MMNKPFVSVIIPVYNAEQTLGACLESLIRQTYPQDRYEIIIVDDGSQDNTVMLARTFPVVLVSQENQGPGAARNRGINIAKGDIILFTDADCIPEKNWIEAMVLPFKNPEIMGVKGIYKTRQHSLVARFAQLEYEEKYQKLRQDDFIDFVDTYAAGFRKTVFLEEGGFDPDFPIAAGEDADFSYRLATRGYKMIFHPDAIVYHHHPDTLVKYLRRKFKTAHSRVMVYKKNPEKMVTDSHTPQMLKVQIGLAFLVIVSFFTIGSYDHWKMFAFWSVVLFLLSTLPFFLFSFTKDLRVSLCSPVLLFLRSTIFIPGLAKGFYDLLRKEGVLV
jgi:glycosyltransferase involved in cell wall biosynthesis